MSAVSKIIRDLDDQVDALTAERDRLRAALESLEWAAELGDDHGHYRPACHLCRRFQPEGHSPNCIIGLAVKGRE